MIGFPEIQIGVFLAAHTYAGRVGPNIADVAPIGNHQALAVFVDEHGAIVNAIDFEMVGSIEMAEGLEIGVPKALVVKHPKSGTVTIERDELVVGSLESGFVVARPGEFPANRSTCSGGKA